MEYVTLCDKFQIKFLKVAGNWLILNIYVTIIIWYLEDVKI